MKQSALIREGEVLAWRGFLLEIKVNVPWVLAWRGFQMKLGAEGCSIGCRLCY